MPLPHSCSQVGRTAPRPAVRGATGRDLATTPQVAGGRRDLIEQRRRPSLGCDNRPPSRPVQHALVKQ